VFAELLPLLLSALAFSVATTEVASSGTDLEPCTNGAPSASGIFPTQAMEERFNAYLPGSVKAGRPGSRFEAGADRSSATHPPR
jgi:hypothetical protein